MSSLSAGESKYSTCPARFGGRSSLKRDSNQISLWELQEAMLTDSTAGAMLESSSQVAPSRLSGTSAHSGDYGSWPRSRKQRTDAGSPRRSVVSMWAADADASLAPLASANPAPLAPASRAATSEEVAASGSVAQLDAMCLAAHEPDEASEGIALAALEEMARELKAEAEAESGTESGSEEVEAEPTGAAAVAAVAAVGGGAAAVAAVAAVGGGAAAQELAQTLSAAADMAGDVGGDMGGDMGGDVAAEQPEQGDLLAGDMAGDRDLLAGDLLSLLQQPSCWDLPEGGASFPRAGARAGGGEKDGREALTRGEGGEAAGGVAPSPPSPSPLLLRPPPPLPPPPPPDLTSLLGGLGVADGELGVGASAALLSDMPLTTTPSSTPTPLRMGASALSTPTPMRMGASALVPAPPPPAAAAAAGQQGARPPPLHHVTPRADWAASEDQLIREGVAKFGCKWRRIALQLPGRSDDAVRNRWHRLQPGGKPKADKADKPLPAAGGAGGAAAAGAVLAPRTGVASGLRPSSSAGYHPSAGGGASPQGDSPKVERVSWTAREDQIILDGVHELGHKWNRLAHRLHGRTEHAIRNRYHRLQSLAADRHVAPPQSVQSVQGVQSVQSVQSVQGVLQPAKPARAGAGASGGGTRGGVDSGLIGMLGMRKVAAADLAAELSLDLAAEDEISLPEISLPPLSPTAAFRLHCI